MWCFQSQEALYPARGGKRAKRQQRRQKSENRDQTTGAAIGYRFELVGGCFYRSLLRSLIVSGKRFSTDRASLRD